MSENNTDEIALLFVLFSVKLCKLKKDIRYLVKWQFVPKDTVEVYCVQSKQSRKFNARTK